jgi:anti-sigma factor RsiW
MSIQGHPLAQLSAYLDGALAPAERTALDAHLDGCAGCRARLAELRATASLIGSLPDLAPTRRLVPRVAPAPAWLAPLRTMTTVASGFSVFVFLATALLANVGGAPTTSSGAAAPAPAALQASAAPSSPSRGVQAPAAAPTALNAADAAKASAPSAPPSAQPGDAVASASAGFSTTSSQAPAAASQVAEVGARSDNTLARERDTRPVLTSPWLWLGLAIVFGIAALGLQRRLRST